jgi:pseudaminic acid synthase
MRIGKRKISENHPPFIIAELSANHNNSIDRTFDLINEAKSAGADAIKIQTYTADTITLNSKKKDFLIDDKKSLWHGKYLYELYQKGTMPWEWYKRIFSYAKKKNIICFSSPFDESAVNFLKKFNVPAYKIASFENQHFTLLKSVIKTNKSIIVSLGATKLIEILELNNFFKKNNYKNYCFLKCTSAYPAPVNESNLKTILDLRKKFKIEIGLSDHTPGIGASIAAIAFGATVIEKHFTLNKKDGGLDDIFSITPHELNLLVVEGKRAWQSIGKVTYSISKTEKKSLKFKRSIFASKIILKGEKFTKDNIKVVRPNNGLSPKYYDKIIGKKSARNIDFACPIKKKNVNFLK